MTLTELRYLVNLDKERHFGRAAERSFVSQPTLSVALKKLEDELGVTLFERNRGEALPTPVGERIIDQARRVLAEAHLVKDLAIAGRDETAGSLRLGAIYTVAPYLLPALVPLLHERSPQMPLVIEENFTARLLEQLRDAEIDVALVALPVELSGLQAWALYDEDFVVCLPRKHRWSERETIPARELAEEHLLLLGSGHCFREQVIEACPKCVDPDGANGAPQTGSSLETIRHMVVSGLGITVLPASSLTRQLGDEWLTARPFAPPAPKRRIAMVWRGSFPRLKAITAVHDAILACGMQGVRYLPEEPMPAAATD